MTHGVTILQPQGPAQASTSGHRTTGLAPELLSQSVSRLRILTLLYAFTFFMAGVFPNLVNPEWRAFYWGNPENWVPALISIAMALVIWALAMSPRIPLSTVMNVGLAFEVVSCYGIALAEYLEPTRLNLNGWIGLSWVAAWAPLFTVVIPTRPVKAALVTLVSVLSVPIVIGFMVVSERTTFRPDANRFFFWTVLPYLLITIMAYVGARVVYTLGRAVTEARELGSYRLVERLGQGGMGEVWRAKHRLLARPAAIKLIRAADGTGTAAQQEAIRRFEREAQVTAGLSSPHTVQLFDFGVADDGSFYYVMELLNGLDLERLVQRYGPIPAERAVYLLRQVCQSLAEAESYGLVHRDIKPANLFVCRYGGEHDFLKVLDFGIAKPAPDMMQTGAMGFTQDNVLQGTPAYIAPEQVMNGSNVDGRADIYATGCVGYFLLTGKPVFTGDTPMAVVVQHAHSQPAAPSESSELPIPPALDRLILDCLAKSPSDRPQSARELSQRLAEVDMANAWTEDRARDWWGTHQPVPKSRLSVAGPEAESARHA
ncbi:MAG TPA: serine/threonine-protein kinase [Vicinamibacterales bacterium]|nr:serine/threonine-protein kinase [Vicinamibacterales bacterium]